jgi:hypothetical protein
MATADHFASALICAAILLEWEGVEAIISARNEMDGRLQEIGKRAGIRSLQEVPPEA